MTNNFDKCNAVTLDFEGGNDSDPHDPGGRTSRGIEQREWNSYTRTHSQFAHYADVWTAPQAAIVDIYRTQYWNPVCGDQWATGLDLCVYDAGVNSGLGKSLAWARAAFNEGKGTFLLLASLSTALKDQAPYIHRYQAKRLGFLEALGTWKYFGRGWRSRVAGIESIAIKWALQAAGKPPEIVADTLQKTASQARDKSNAASGTAAAAPAAPVAHYSYVQHTDWLHYAIDAALVIGAICLVAYLVHLALNHSARATAFANTAEVSK